jgi:hypothetical protein
MPPISEDKLKRNIKENRTLNYSCHECRGFHGDDVSCRCLLGCDAGYENFCGRRLHGRPTCWYPTTAILVHGVTTQKTSTWSIHVTFTGFISSAHLGLWVRNSCCDGGVLYSVQYTDHTLAAGKVKVKVNVKLSLCFFFLTEHHSMKVYWGRGGIAKVIVWPRH